MENAGCLPKLPEKSHVSFNPWSYHDRYDSLQKYYMQCPPLSKLDCIDYKIETKQTHNKQENKQPREILSNEVIIIEEPASRPELCSRCTSTKTSEKYFTGEEDFTDASESESVSSFEQRPLDENLDDNSINELLHMLHEITNDDDDTLELDGSRAAENNEFKFIREKVSSSAKIDPSSVWSKVLYFTDQVMQSNMKSGITDTSFQLPLAILVADVLVARTIQIIPRIKNLYCILQPFISPCEPLASSETHCDYSETCITTPPPPHHPSPFHRSQQYSTPEDSVHSKINDWMFDLSGRVTPETRSTENLMGDLEVYFKSLEELKDLVNSDSVQELVVDTGHVCGDYAFNIDHNFVENQRHAENPMLKIIPGFINENYGW